MMRMIMNLMLQFIDGFNIAAEMGSQALEHDTQFLELVLAGAQVLG